MIQAHLNQAVARVTGDDYRLIDRMGFSLVEDEPPLSDADIEALVADWDHIQEEARLRDLHFDESDNPLSRAQNAAGAKTKQKRTRRSHAFRRIESAH